MSHILHGWKGWLSYLKSFSKSHRMSEIASQRTSLLLLYRKLDKAIRLHCPRYGLRVSKKAEFKFYFSECQFIEDPQDLRYFMNVMSDVLDRLEKGEYPPFPRRLPSMFSFHSRKELFLYRKFVNNIYKTDMILEPGQDPVRSPFIDPRQAHTDMMREPDYVRDIKDGIDFPEEAALFSDKK